MIIEQQEPTKESMLILLEEYKKLVKHLLKQDFERCVVICKKGIKLANSIEKFEFTADFELQMGKAFVNLGEMQNAQKCFIRAHLLFKESELINQRIVALKNIALTYMVKHEHNKGIKILYEAAGLVNKNVEKVNDGLKMTIFQNIGNTHHVLGFDQKAMEYYAKALDLKKDNELKEKQDEKLLEIKCKTLFCVGTSQTQLKNFSASKKAFEEALFIANKTKNYTETILIYDGISSLYIHYKEYKKALDYVLIGFKLAKELNAQRHKEILAETIIQILKHFIPNNTFFKVNQHEFTIEGLLDNIEKIALFKKSNILILDIYEVKSNYFTTIKEWEKAFEYKEKTIKVLNEKYKEENKRELDKEKALNQIKQKDKELQHQTKLLDKEREANRKLQKINHQIKEQNQLMVQKSEELQGILRELENFAFITSHDLKEPLRNISSFLQLLKIKYADVLDENGLSYIDFSLKGANQIKKLIEDLLLYTKLSNQQHVFKKCNLNQTLNLVTKDLRINIEEKKLRIVNTRPLPEIIANKEMMILLFHHVISNALKYKGDKDPIIEITHNINKENILLSFKDNGIGIDEIFQNKIFDIFRRLHNNDTHKGTGIGLTICKKIVGLHTGNIWFKSTLGQGTTFFVELPLNRSKH